MNYYKMNNLDALKDNAITIYAYNSKEMVRISYIRNNQSYVLHIRGLETIKDICKYFTTLNIKKIIHGYFFIKEKKKLEHVIVQ